MPASIPNGFVVGSGNLEGSSYEFFCKDGYSLVGSVTTYCTSEGSWNSSVPICLRGKRQKKKCIPRDVYSRFGYERKWNQSIAPMFIVKIPDTIKMKERNSHSTSIMVVELILQYYSLPKLFNCLDRTHENWFLWGIIYIAHFCIGMLKHALYQWQWKKHFQLKKLDQQLTWQKAVIWLSAKCCEIEHWATKTKPASDQRVGFELELSSRKSSALITGARALPVILRS